MQVDSRPRGPEKAHLPVGRRNRGPDAAKPRFPTGSGTYSGTVCSTAPARKPSNFRGSFVGIRWHAEFHREPSDDRGDEEFAIHEIGRFLEKLEEDDRGRGCPE